MSKVWTGFGNSAHARTAFHIAVPGGDSVAAFVDENSDALVPVPGATVWPVPMLAAAPRGDLFAAEGRAEVRRRLMDAAAASGWRLPPPVHPSASVAPDAVPGEGAMLAAGAVEIGGAHIGCGCIVDIGMLNDHGCEVAAFTHPHAGQARAAGTRWPA